MELIEKNNNCGSNSAAFGGTPDPSTIQGNSGGPLLWDVGTPDFIISCNFAWNEVTQMRGTKERLILAKLNTSFYQPKPCLLKLFQFLVLIDFVSHKFLNEDRTLH